eukprot:scaffold267015_cov19-Prasinocladus_malaysianus.AAC.1
MSSQGVERGGAVGTTPRPSQGKCCPICRTGPFRHILCSAVVISLCLLRYNVVCSRGVVISGSQHGK